LVPGGGKCHVKHKSDGVYVSALRNTKIYLDYQAYGGHSLSPSVDLRKRKGEVLLGQR
jgi:hypothetical protein